MPRQAGAGIGITADQYPRVAAEWQNKDFVTIDIGEGLTNLIKQFFIFKQTRLSDQQELILRETIYNWIATHVSGTYEDYKRFRVPVEAKVNPAKIDVIRDQVRRLQKPGSDYSIFDG
jgi:hypothetical protein